MSNIPQVLNQKWPYASQLLSEAYNLQTWDFIRGFCDNRQGWLYFAVASLYLLWNLYPQWAPLSAALEDGHWNGIC